MGTAVAPWHARWSHPLCCVTPRVKLRITVHYAVNGKWKHSKWMFLAFPFGANLLFGVSWKHTVGLISVLMRSEHGFEARWVRRLPAGIHLRRRLIFCKNTRVRQRQVTAGQGVRTRLNLYRCMFTAGTGGDFLPLPPLTSKHFHPHQTLTSTNMPFWKTWHGSNPD